MGKNRRSGGNGGDANPDTYTTLSGETVPTDGHSQEFMETLNDKMAEWLEVGGDNLQKFTDEEVKYIHDNMESSMDDPDIENGQLTRVEFGRHLLPAIINGLKEGDSLPVDLDLISFSGSRFVSNMFAHGRKGSIVIYRTNGEIPHYSTDKLAKRYEEKEMLVNPQSLKVDKIQHMKVEDYPSRKDYTLAMYNELKYTPWDEVLEQFENNFEDNPNYWQSNDVYFVDVSAK